MTSQMPCSRKSRNVLKLGDTGSIVVGRTRFKPATYRTTQDRRQRSNHLSQELSSFNTYRKYLIHAESKSAVFILIFFFLETNTLKCHLQLYYNVRKMNIENEYFKMNTTLNRVIVLHGPALVNR